MTDDQLRPRQSRHVHRPPPCLVFAVIFVAIFLLHAAAAATSLFLGRSRILRPRRARSSAHRKPDSAHDGLERASAAGDGLGRAVVEVCRLRAASDALGHAGGRRILAARSISPGPARRQHRGRDRLDVCARRCIQFSSRRVRWRRWISPPRDLPSGALMRLPRRSSGRDRDLVFAGCARQRNGDSCAGGPWRAGSILRCAAAIASSNGRSMWGQPPAGCQSS